MVEGAGTSIESGYPETNGGQATTSFGLPLRRRRGAAPPRTAFEGRPREPGEAGRHPAVPRSRRAGPPGLRPPPPGGGGDAPATTAGAEPATGTGRPPPSIPPRP